MPRPRAHLVLALLTAAALAPGAGAQQLEGADFRPYARPFALTNARVETVTQGVIERATVVLRDGRIEAVGPDVAVPPDAEVLDCAGLTLYPGLIDAGTRLGLQEIGSADETIDLDEVGEVTPHMEALTAYNPNSALIPVARVAGVTTVLASPTGGLFPGTAALVDLFGYSPEGVDAGFRGTVLRFPARARRGSGDRRPEEEVQRAYEEALERLDETWRQAVLWARIDSAHTADPRANAAPLFQPEMAALAPAVRGARLLLVEANAAPDLLRAIEWLAARPRVRAALVGAAEGWRVAGRIAEAGLPVLAGPVLSQPARPGDRYDRAYANPALLHRAGVAVALRTTETENVRNLPFHAGTAAAYGAEYGFDRQAALEAVTIVPARLFGVDHRRGSIEVGKDATLFAVDGDPFEPRTQVRHLFIRGYRLPLTSRQTMLYEEFLHRDPAAPAPR